MKESGLVYFQVKLNFEFRTSNRLVMEEQTNFITETELPSPNPTRLTKALEDLATHTSDSPESG